MKTVNNATLWVYLASKLRDDRKIEEYSSVVVTCSSPSSARRGVGRAVAGARFGITFSVRCGFGREGCESGYGSQC
jgi:hypothetical protein